ncbi:helix-turn-helix domain-containing protein [Algiphilus aromaticivorans]|uniref:helix-turn-helix domain-containing protein n=1 Tax=Algiphilus aromaticivorans TaxID=382454 RepID=UPI0018DE8A3D
MLTDLSNWPPSPAPTDIRSAREAAGLTQAQAGALIYRSPEVWASWERGRRPLDPALWELWQMRAEDPGWIARVSI